LLFLKVDVALPRQSWFQILLTPRDNRVLLVLGQGQAATDYDNQVTIFIATPLEEPMPESVADQSKVFAESHLMLVLVMTMKSVQSDGS
jgi:hypothetical protein